MNQLSVVIFKPDATLEVRQEFFDELDANDLKIAHIGEKFLFTPDILEDHYGHVRKYGEHVFRGLEEFLLDNDAFCTPMVVEGEESIAKVRAIIGPTRGATVGIRRTSESANLEINSPKNYIHASGNEAEARDELSRFFPQKTFVF